MICLSNFRIAESAGAQIDSLVLNGGPTKSRLWNQITANVVNRPLKVPDIGEAAPIGDAILAGVAAGIYKDPIEPLSQIVTIKETIDPDSEVHKRYADFFEVWRSVYHSPEGRHGSAPRAPETLRRAGMTENGPLLEVREITKQFPGVVALSDVSFDLKAGEVHSLVGENGAGKSTLLSCMNGLQLPSKGAIYLHGRKVTFSKPADAIRQRLSMVHQELVLCPNLTVAENIYLGREPSKSGGMADRARMLRDAKALLAEIKVEIDPNRPARVA